MRPIGRLQSGAGNLRLRSNGRRASGIGATILVLGALPPWWTIGGSGLAQMQMAATLVGVSVPSRTRNLELKPYAVASSTTDLTAAQPFRNDGTGDVGVMSASTSRNALRKSCRMSVRTFCARK